MEGPPDRATIDTPLQGVSTRYRNLLFFIAIFVGVLCRVAQYAADQSYWHDEAAIVLNIRTHTARQLLGPLDFVQAAPPMFLLTERAVYKMLGPSEYAMRLAPFAVGIASLLIFAALSRRLLSPPWDTAAVAMFALGDRLIWHGVEAKPYGNDLFVALLLTLLAIGPRAEMPAQRRLLHVSLAAMLAMWFSYATVLIFAGLSLSLLPEILSTRRRGWARYALLNLPAAGSFLFVLCTSMRIQRSPALMNYWQSEFMNLSRPWTWPWWLARHLHSLCNYALPLAGPVILAGSIAGAIALCRGRQKQLLSILAAPIGVALLASAAHRYPFDGARLTLFLDGSVLLLAVIGFQWLVSALPSQVRQFSLLLPAFALISAMVFAVMHLVQPRNRGHMRPVAEYLAKASRPDDALFVLEQCEFECYWRTDDPRVHWALPPADSITAPRFWIVWSDSNTAARRRRPAIIEWAKRFATEGETFVVRDAEAHLFQRTGAAISSSESQPPAVKN